MTGTCTSRQWQTVRWVLVLNWLMKTYKMTRQPIVLCLRPAGTFAYFYVGVWRALEHLTERLRLYGLSSGAFVSTLIAAGIVEADATTVFEELLEHRKRETMQSSWWLRLLYTPWHGSRCRYHVVPQVLRHFIDEERLAKINAEGRLTIVAYDVLCRRVVYCRRWRNVDHLIEWVLSAMAIPAVTSMPRWVDGRLLMDAFNLDLYHDHVDMDTKRRWFEMSASPLDERAAIAPKPLPNIALSLCEPSQELRTYLEQSGYQSARCYLERQLCVRMMMAWRAILVLWMFRMRKMGVRTVCSPHSLIG